MPRNKSEISFVKDLNTLLLAIGSTRTLKSHYIKSQYRKDISLSILNFANNHEECNNSTLVENAQMWITEKYATRLMLNQLIEEVQKGLPNNEDVQALKKRIIRNRKKSKSKQQTNDAPQTNDAAPVRSGSGSTPRFIIQPAVIVEKPSLREQIIQKLVDNDHYNFQSTESTIIVDRPDFHKEIVDLLIENNHYMFSSTASKIEIHF